MDARLQIRAVLQNSKKAYSSLAKPYTHLENVADLVTTTRDGNPYIPGTAGDGLVILNWLIV